MRSLYLGYHPLILTFDPNFQLDIQVPGQVRIRYRQLLPFARHLVGNMAISWLICSSLSAQPSEERWANHHDQHQPDTHTVHSISTRSYSRIRMYDICKGTRTAFVGGDITSIMLSRKLIIIITSERRTWLSKRHQKHQYLLLKGQVHIPINSWSWIFETWTHKSPKTHPFFPSSETLCVFIPNLCNYPKTNLPQWSTTWRIIPVSKLGSPPFISHKKPCSTYAWGYRIPFSYLFFQRMKHEAGSEARNTTHMGTPQMSEVLTPGGKFKALSIPLLAQTSTINATHHSSQGHRHDNFFPQIVPIIGALASEEQICALTQTHSHLAVVVPCPALQEWWWLPRKDSLMLSSKCVSMPLELWCSPERCSRERHCLQCESQTHPKWCSPERRSQKRHRPQS